MSSGSDLFYVTVIIFKNQPIGITLKKGTIHINCLTIKANKENFKNIYLCTVNILVPSKFFPSCSLNSHSIPNAVLLQDPAGPAGLREGALHPAGWPGAQPLLSTQTRPLPQVAGTLSYSSH